MANSDLPARVKTHSYQPVVILFLVIFSIVTGLYWTVRYGGRAMEVDATRLTLAADGIYHEGRLVTPKAYPGGFGYPAQLTFISNLLDISVQDIQLNASIWLFVVGLAAFIAYRELLEQPLAAGLATLLLLVQPDFLFYILRGSHEKTTWLYALLMLFLLARSYRAAQDPKRLVIYILSFYLVFMAMAAGNAYFASTFVAALAASFSLGWLLSHWKSFKSSPFASAQARVSRLLVISLACFVIVFVFISYIYPPALSYFYTLADMADRVKSLLLGSHPIEQPYGYVETAWRSPGVYLALTGIQWIVAVTSIIAWLWAARRLVKADSKGWLVWLMYTGFGFQLAIAIVADLSGSLSTNTIVRIFTPFTLFSVSLAANLIIHCFNQLSFKKQRVAFGALAILVAYATVASLLKVTIDPVVGNQWIFYTPRELKAVLWTDENVKSQQVWLDTSYSMFYVLSFWEGYSWKPANSYVYGLSSSPEPYILISDIRRIEAARSGIGLPSTIGYNRIYDTGDVQLFHRRPRTPYQR